MEIQPSDEITSSSFLKDKDAIQFFARVDYYLKSGGHIQRTYPKPAGIYRFVDQNYESLKLYYHEFFRVYLTHEGNDFLSYYYIDFEEGSRGNISQDNRQFLSLESVIIGLLFIKLSKLDGHFDLESVSQFSSLLFTEYEEEKEALFKLVLNSNSTNSTDRDEESITKLLINSFKKFAELGWIYWLDDEKDKFDVLPSFERLRKMYQHQIENIDELIQGESND